MNLSKIWTAAVAATLVNTQTLPQNYTEAAKLQESEIASSDYVTFLDRFLDFSNVNHLDSKAGCHEVGANSVSMFIIIVRSDSSEKSRIAEVFSETDSPKAECFRMAYLGLQLPIATPKSVPYAIKLVFHSGTSLST